METKAHNVTVGAFVLAGILALVVVIIFLGRGQFGQQNAYYQTSFTESVTGLAKGTVVRYNGIDVGHVYKLEFDPKDPKRVVSVLEVDRGVALHSDSAAILASEGLTGASYVEIEGGSANAPILAQPGLGGPYPLIASKPSPFQQVKEVAPQLLNRLDTVADRASDVLNEQNRQALPQTLDNLTVASKRLSETLVSTQDAARRVGQLSTSVENVAGNVDKVVGNVDDVVSASKNQIAESAAQLNQLLAQSRVLVDSLTRLSN